VIVNDGRIRVKNKKRKEKDGRCMMRKEWLSAEYLYLNANRQNIHTTRGILVLNIYGENPHPSSRQRGII
jgi:hypothetical protein